MAINDELSAVNAAMKIYYKGGKLVKLGYKNHPFYGLIRKNKGFKGISVPIVPWFARTAGQSHLLPKAQANASSEETAAFQIKVKRNYTVTTIDRMNMLATASDEGSYLKLMTDSVDGCAMVHANDIAGKLYRNFGGSRGQIAASNGVAAGPPVVLTLANPGDIVNFEKNMVLVSAANDGTLGGAPRAGVGKITAVDRILGKITVDSAAGFANGDHLFLEGDFGLSYYGVAAWVPTTAPSTSDNFLGVNRSVDSRLYGQYFDGSSMSIAEALNAIDVRLSREGHAADHCFINPVQFGIFREELTPQVTYDKAASPKDASVSFESIRFQGMKGPIQVVPDPDCPQGEMLVTELSSWTLWSIGEVPQPAEMNGLKFITQTAADGGEVRLASYAQLANDNPGASARVKTVAA